MRTGRSRVATSQRALGVDVVVDMHDAMAHADNLMPWEIRGSGSGGVADVRGGFADFLDAILEGSTEDPIRIQIGALLARDERSGLAGRVEHVHHADAIFERA